MDYYFSFIMKVALFGDNHSRNVSDLEQKLNGDYDILVNTGDYDQTKSIHEFLEWKERAEKEGKIIIEVPANHDHATLMGFPINSGTIHQQGKSFGELYNELHADPIALAYIKSLVGEKGENNRAEFVLDEGKFGKKHHVGVVHGAYGGNLYSLGRDYPRGIADLWRRLDQWGDHRENFDAMQIEGINIMLRGHDHAPNYAFRDLNNSNMLPNSSVPTIGEEYDLSHDLHTVTPGALFEGYYAIIDTSKADVPVLTYHQL
jgi:hypothetical protein